MNKIITIALLTAIASPGVAKTKVYGELHASYDKIFAVGSQSQDNFALNDFIVGFKGSTEIKKDVSFIYQISWGINSPSLEDNDNSGFNNRNQVIGIASPSGAVIIGRFDTPFKVVGRKADLFWHSQLGQNRNITNTRNWDVRADKIIAFQSPKINGFQGSVAYASDISDTSRRTQNGQAISVNGFYQKGKYLLGAAYEHHDLDSSIRFITNQSANTEALRLSAVYKDGPIKVIGFYQREDNDFIATTEPDATVVGIGAAYRKGKGTMKAQFYKRDADSTAKNADLIAIGYDYEISKQLDVYANAVQVNNTAGIGGYDIRNAEAAVLNDADGVSIGVRYKF